MTEAEDKTALYAANKLARLLAVQALYRASYEEETVPEILASTLERTDEAIVGDEENDEPSGSLKPDAELFAAIVKGVGENKADLEDMLKGALDERHSFPRMEKLLRGIFLCGAYELHHSTSVPAGVIINDYVDVTRAFFAAKEPALVNAVLDKLAKTLRS